MGITIDGVGDLDYQMRMSFDRVRSADADFGQATRLFQQGSLPAVVPEKVVDWEEKAETLMVYLRLRLFTMSSALEEFLDEHKTLMRVTYLPNGKIEEPKAESFDFIERLSEFSPTLFGYKGEKMDSAREMMRQTGMLHLELPEKLRVGLRHIAMEQVTDVHIDVMRSNVHIEYRIPQDIEEPVDYLRGVAAVLGSRT